MMAIFQTELFQLSSATPILISVAAILISVAALGIVNG
jgi:hypothetical protein